MFAHLRSTVLLTSLLFSTYMLSSCGSSQTTEVKPPAATPLTLQTPATMASSIPTDSGNLSTSTGMGMKPLTDGACPTGEPIKGKLNRKGHKILHEPGSPRYDRVKATECFKTVADAEKAGYHAMKMDKIHSDENSPNPNQG